MDEQIMWAVNGLVGRSPFADVVFAPFLANPIFKGIPLSLLFLYLWFGVGPDTHRRRTFLLATLVVSTTAIAVGRLLAIVLPYRLRPIHSEMGFRPVREDEISALEGWSSLPSDHAVFFFAITACFWFIDRRIGVLAGVYSVFTVMFIRVYFLLHWPSDVLVGALVGIAVSLALMKPAARLIRRTGLLELGERHPQWMQPALFFVLFQVSTMFDSVRSAAAAAIRFVT